MYEEWHGLGQYEVSNPGGLAGLQRGGPSWRRGWSNGEQKRFSRLKKVVTNMDEEAAAGGEIDDVLKKYDEIFKHHPSLTAMAKHMSN
jgi:hypothetical protein